MSLMKISDDAIKGLIDYFTNVEDDTIIVFFGDHQPTNSVVSDIWKLNNKNGNNLSTDDEALRYVVPFFIWGNYDIAEASNVETSANYLGAKLLDVSGLPLNSYSNFLLELSNEYPIVTSIRTKNSTGKSMDTKEALDNLNNYAILQYNSLFD